MSSLNSSIVKWGYKDNFKPVYFFYVEVLSVEKHQTQSKRKIFFTWEKLLPLLFSINLFLFCQLIFACDVLLCAQNLFLKKIYRFEILFITSLYYTTDVYSYQPAYLEFICTHLFLFVIICDNLFSVWESFLSVTF